jgi:hypothetical protein
MVQLYSYQVSIMMSVPARCGISTAAREPIEIFQAAAAVFLEQLQEPEIHQQTQTHTPGKLNVLRV